MSVLSIKNSEFGNASFNDFTEAEKYVLTAISCSWIKSWVVFQRFCLKDPIGCIRVK